jgi:hypothetical protein
MTLAVSHYAIAAASSMNIKRVCLCNTETRDTEYSLYHCVIVQRHEHITWKYFTVLCY